MSFRVVATPEAELARCWLRANDRKAVTAAQHRIEQLLLKSPKNSGQELAEQLWKMKCLLSLLISRSMNFSKRLLSRDLPCSLEG
jgi:hypothetical protein